MNALRQPVLVQLAEPTRGSSRVLARTQCFTIERVADEGVATFEFGAASEIILLLPASAASIWGEHEATVPGHAIAILPAGSYALRLATPGEAYILSTDRLATSAEQPVNGGMYAQPDLRVRPVGAPFERRHTHYGIRIHLVTDIAIPPDNGRLRFLQSETMSVNWVEYDGVRGRSALSPHAHDDIEQASLALAGDFVHHLRTPWGRDADLWREDAHMAAGPGSVVIIPPDIIHTTEGVGGGRHILVDIFTPPRRDFIARNWMFNAADYAAPAEAVA